jgi:hypothetical protein
VGENAVVPADVLSLQAILPALAGLLASAMAIHSLMLPTMTYRRKVVCRLYVFLTLLITIGLVYYGATQHEETREQAAAANDIKVGLDRLRALMGNNPNLTGPQVLQGIIERFSKPYGISEPQTSRLADELFIIKAELPQGVKITQAPNDSEANILAWKLGAAFSRAGIKPLPVPVQIPSSPSEVGITFSVLDQQNPPPIVLKLQRIFDLVNINTTIVNADKDYIGPGGFNIFVGPKPI